MDNVRTFWLVDDRDEVFDLMGKGTDFFHAPQGLGQSQTVSYSNLSTMREVNKKENQFQTVKGEMLFSSYADSSNFRRFVNKSKQRVRLYQKLPGVDGEFYAEVNVTLIDRKEKDLNGLLKCEVSFECMTFWTKEVVISTADRNGDKPNTTQTYAYTYPYTYANSVQNSVYQQILLTNNGDIPAPLKITIFGVSVSPEWSIDEQLGKINYTVQSGMYLVIDSRDNVHAMTVGETNVDNYKEHRLKNFIYADVGDNNLLFKNTTKVEVSMYEYYLSI